MDGKAHFIGGIMASIIIWIVIWVINHNFSPIGCLVAVLFGGLFALFPDTDLKLHMGHRHPLTHSAIIPGFILIMMSIAAMYARADVLASEKQSIIFIYNFTISFAVYFSAAVASHLLLDFLQGDVVKLSKLQSQIFLLSNGIGLIMASIFIGVLLLI